jgi:hypothetical protein
VAEVFSPARHTVLMEGIITSCRNTTPHVPLARPQVAHSRLPITALAICSNGTPTAQRPTLPHTQITIRPALRNRCDNAETFFATDCRSSQAPIASTLAERADTASCLCASDFVTTKVECGASRGTPRSAGWLSLFDLQSPQKVGPALGLGAKAGSAVSGETARLVERYVRIVVGWGAALARCCLQGYAAMVPRNSRCGAGMGAGTTAQPCRWTR